MAFTHSLRSASASIDCKDVDVVIVPTTSAVTISLPDPATNPVGSRRIIKKSGASGTITVSSMGSATIDGAASYSLSVQWKYVDVVSDGANWFIVGAN
jgi:hypothetical protein